MKAEVDVTESAPWYPVANVLAHDLIERTGTSVRAVILYGSHILAANPDRHSAYDFMVVVDSYRDFYEHLKMSGELNRPVRVMSALARVLPPNVIAFVPEDGAHGIAKCIVVEKTDLERALGPEPKDHFLLGRLVQKVGLVWTASREEEHWLESLLAGARARVLDWMAPYLEGSFDARQLGRRMLEVCYAGEFRPEARNRAESIFQSQADHFEDSLGPVLEAAEREGRVVSFGGQYRLAEDVPAAQVRRWRRHFLRSKVRSTTRWLKHTVTFDNWLPYVVRKVERHRGEKIELTRLERRWPLIFLWPRVIHVLTTRPEKKGRR